MPVLIQKIKKKIQKILKKISTSKYRAKRSIKHEIQAISTSVMNWFSERKHQRELSKLRKKHRPKQRQPSTSVRALSLVAAGIATASIFTPIGTPIFELLNIEWFSKTHSSVLKHLFNENKALLQFKGFIATSFVLFVIWIFRDINKQLELANQRKDTNLKEFQQLQQWATGNIQSADEANHPTLQISALHQLRNYLRGNYGEDFRRPAFEIFAAQLERIHGSILSQIGEESNQKGGAKYRHSIEKLINANPIAVQLNRIVQEEWFSLLVDHQFPMATISLVGVDLSDAYLAKRNLSQARLQGASLDYAQMQGANLYEAQMQGANLTEAQMQGANLTEAQMQGANLTEAQMQGANLTEAQMQGANLTEAQMQGADLYQAQMQGADLQGTQMQGADLYQAQMQGANLEGTKMQGASLDYAQMQGAVLTHTDLRGVLLDGGISLTKRAHQSALRSNCNKVPDYATLELACGTLTETMVKEILQEFSTQGSNNEVKKYLTKSIQQLEKRTGQSAALSEATTGALNAEESTEIIAMIEKRPDNELF